MEIKKRKLLEVISFIVLFLGFSYFLFHVIDFGIFVGKIGYFKYILIPFVTIFGSTLLTASFIYPILLAFNQSGINIFLLAFLAGIGGAIGDLLFVLFGRKIKESTEREQFEKVRIFFERNKNSPFLSSLIFLYAAFFPLPNELMTLALGYLKYPLKKILIPLILGNALYYLILVLIGGSILNLIF